MPVTISGGPAKSESSALKPGGRSPAYPYIPLARALERAEQLKAAEGFYAVPPESAYKAWGFGGKSSGARQTLAALKHFGLITYVGLGEGRKVRLSDLSKRILLDSRPDSPDKPKLIREAALKPAIHADLISQFPNGLPSDTTLHTFLVLQREFNESGAKDLIAEFRETASFAGLFAENADAGDPAEAQTVSVGDLVQVEIDGVLQFEKPAKVRDVQEHDGATWVLTDASDTWVLSSSVVPTVVTTSESQSPTPPPSPITPRPKIEERPSETSALDVGTHRRSEGWREERLIDDSGDEILLIYKGDPTESRYEFVRDYLDFKISRLRATDARRT